MEANYQTGMTSKITIQLLLPLAAVAAGCALLSCKPKATMRATCTHASLDSLLEASQTNLHFSGTHFSGAESDSVVFGAPPGQTTWIAARWEGPPDGASIIVGCDGRLLAAARTGYALHLARGPTRVGFAETVLLEESPGGGTGHEQRDLVLLGRSGNSIDSLWRVTSYDRDQSMLNSPGVEETRSANISATGDTIDVVGVRKTSSYASATNKWNVRDSTVLPPERFCWNAARRRYQKCGPGHV